MKPLRERMDRLSSHFEAGGRLERLGPVWEALDTLAYTPGEVTRTASHVRDGLDYKRLMTIVVIALLPCFAMAFFNTGYQASLALQAGATPLADWQNALYQWLGGLKSDPRKVFIIHGESGSARHFCEFLKEKKSWDVSVPSYRDEVILD